MLSTEAEETNPCPNCGKQPKLVQVGYELSRSYGSPSLYLMRYECRKWLGLRLCHAPKKPTYVAKGSYYFRWKNVCMGTWNNSIPKKG